MEPVHQNPTPSIPYTEMSEGPPPMTAGAVLAYCEAQFDQLNTAFATYTSQAQTTQTLAAALNNLKTNLDTYASGGINNGQTATNPYTPGTSPHNNPQDADFDSIDGQITALINQANADNNPALANNLTAIQQAFRSDGHSGTDDVVTPSDITNLDNQIESANSSLTSDSQMQMISLQSIVSQQNSALQLTTNMLMSISDGQKAVAANIGH